MQGGGLRQAGYCHWHAAAAWCKFLSGQIFGPGPGSSCAGALPNGSATEPPLGPGSTGAGYGRVCTRHIYELDSALPTKGEYLQATSICMAAHAHRRGKRHAAAISLPASRVRWLRNFRMRLLRRRHVPKGATQWRCGSSRFHTMGIWGSNIPAATLRSRMSEPHYTRM